MVAARAPIGFQILGRVLLHAALVGAAAGLFGSLFFACVEAVQRVSLEKWTGYLPLRAGGERILGEMRDVTPFRPWLLVVVPAVGALLGGAISFWLAPETRGGGSDAIIEAFHHHGGFVRKRVAFVKGLVSILTLGSGGSGGREGPTMQMGGALGSLVGQLLRVTDRERRILLVAGTAAGMAAVFRTPLGAALLAVEVLHRDDFEAEALVPSVLASVVAYSVFIAFSASRRSSHTRRNTRSSPNTCRFTPFSRSGYRWSRARFSRCFAGCRRPPVPFAFRSGASPGSGGWRWGCSRRR